MNSIFKNQKKDTCSIDFKKFISNSNANEVDLNQYLLKKRT